MRQPPRRQPLREVVASNRAYMQFLADSVGKELPPALVTFKPKRTYTPNHDRVAERTVLAAVLKALRKHPRVARVRRQQSGVFQAGDRTVRVGKTGALDIQGMLKGGRHFEVECKGEGGKLSRAQAAEIEAINYHGGLAFVAYSVDDVLNALAGMEGAR